MLCSPQNLRFFILLWIVAKMKIDIFFLCVIEFKPYTQRLAGTSCPQCCGLCSWLLKLLGIFSLKILHLEWTMLSHYFCCYELQHVPLACPFLLAQVWTRSKGKPLLLASVHRSMAERVDQMLFCSVLYSHQAALASTSHLLTSV